MVDNEGKTVPKILEHTGTGARKIELSQPEACLPLMDG